MSRSAQRSGQRTIAQRQSHTIQLRRGQSHCKRRGAAPLRLVLGLLKRADLGNSSVKINEGGCGEESNGIRLGAMEGMYHNATRAVVLHRIIQEYLSPNCLRVCGARRAVQGQASSRVHRIAPEAMRLQVGSNGSLPCQVALEMQL
jgi:hypothetical protein